MRLFTWNASILFQLINMIPEDQVVPAQDRSIEENVRDDSFIRTAIRNKVVNITNYGYSLF